VRTSLSCERGGSYYSASSTLFNHLLRCIPVAQEGAKGVHGESTLEILSGRFELKG